MSATVLKQMLLSQRPVVTPPTFCQFTSSSHGLRQRTLPRQVARGARVARITCAATASPEADAKTERIRENARKGVPKPVVKIDNQHDPFATVVDIEYGNELGELLDTVAALRNLKLNISRAKLRQKKGSPNIQRNRFYITDQRTSDKVTKSARLEEIRLTILNNLLQYHPDSAEEIAWGERAKKPAVRSPLEPLGPSHRAVVQTVIDIEEHESGSHTSVYVETTDRPGLLTDIVHWLKDTNVNVISAEVDTEGRIARDTFFVTYHGEALNANMETLVTNVLQYNLSMASVEAEESY
ncbi:hypothetical protein WJX84_012080 [Apatococcus fuscideae]|uniref:ACT domain-containing protein n=1 Tax=Apatococcus fuscideae TaxID=2026836 RepID=A0AAW1SVG3_9CHLO